MSSKRRTAPVIGNIFSSDSSDSDHTPRKYASSGNEKKPRKVSIRLTNYHTDNDRIPMERPEPASVVVPADIPNGYVPFDKTRIGTLPQNALIQYESANGKMVKPKYFKHVDAIAGSIVIGFFKNNRRNYSEKLEKIKALYVQQSANGGAAEDPLKETIELPKDQWKNIRRDMIVSYEKDNGEYIYKAKFNAFIKGTDEASKMSMTSERGFNYIANPSKIKRIFRHITGNDKTLTVILETIRKLEIRVRQLEQKQKK